MKIVILHEGKNNLKAKLPVVQKIWKAVLVESVCEVENRYEFITYKGINDGKNSVNCVSVILEG